jgi:RNase P subunit RPR2
MRIRIPYKHIRVNGKLLQLHRVIAQNAVGPRLTVDDYDVHHKNKLIHDNRIKNLLLTTSLIHHRLDNKSYRLIASNKYEVNGISIITRAVWKKKCGNCNKWFLLSAFYWHKSKGYENPYVGYFCKSCDNIIRRNNYEKKMSAIA